MPPLLEVVKATKYFGGLPAVRDVSFSIEPGELVGLIGPNGAGKTTLISLISRTERLSEGEIRFKGQRISDKTPHEIGRMGVARTFQVVKPFKSMTVLENVAVGAFFGSDGLKRSRAQALDKAHEVLRRVGLDRKSEYLAHALTVPDRKRLEVAKALATDPELLLLDEVMAGLNLAEIDEAMALIQEVNRQGVTVLAIEHVMKAIMGVSQRIIVMDHGQQIAAGTPAEVAANPIVISAYLGKRYAARSATAGAS
ncbi:MAG TPA: ABC transporter ATP-binding protein [Chloroflexota bacterium]|nr:ABC transporter ATP-binding protein [Chloroflexota bacterium]